MVKQFFRKEETASSILASGSFNFVDNNFDNVKISEIINTKKYA